MAQQIHTISQFHPKVIGVDGFMIVKGVSAIPLIAHNFLTRLET